MSATELDKWIKAVHDSRATIAWLEQRNEQKTARIRALEKVLQDQTRTPHPMEGPKHG